MEKAGDRVGPCGPKTKVSDNTAKQRYAVALVSVNAAPQKVT